MADEGEREESTIMAKRYIIKNRGRWNSAYVENTEDGTVEAVPGFSVYNTESRRFVSQNVLTREQAVAEAERLNANAEEQARTDAERVAKNNARLANMTEAEKELEAAQSELKTAEYLLKHEEEDLFAKAGSAADTLEYFAKVMRPDIEFAKNRYEEGNYLPTVSPMQMVIRVMERIRHIQQAQGAGIEGLLRAVSRITEYANEVTEVKAKVAELQARVDAEKAESQAIEQQRATEGMAFIARLNAAPNNVVA